MNKSESLTGIPADLRYAIQFSPRHYRARLAAFCKLYNEIREILQECRDPGIAETKLRWWEEEIGLMLDGKARHPVSQAFWAHCNGLNLASRGFMDIIDGTRMDIHPPGFPAFDSVERYCDLRGGAFADLVVRLRGTDSPAIIAAARQLGRAWQLAGIVTRHTLDARLGRVYFAAEDLRRHQVDQHVVDGVHTDAGLRSLLADYAARAGQLAHDAFTTLSAADRQLLVAPGILAALGLSRLRKLARRDFVAGTEPVELSPFPALLCAWSAARNPGRFIV